MPIASKVILQFHINKTTKKGKKEKPNQTERRRKKKNELNSVANEAKKKVKDSLGNHQEIQRMIIKKKREIREKKLYKNIICMV